MSLYEQLVFLASHEGDSTCVEPRMCRYAVIAGQVSLFDYKNEATSLCKQTALALFPNFCRGKVRGMGVSFRALNFRAFEINRTKYFVFVFLVNNTHFVFTGGKLKLIILERSEPLT